VLRGADSGDFSSWASAQADPATTPVKWPQSRVVKPQHFLDAAQVAWDKVISPQLGVRLLFVRDDGALLVACPDEATTQRFEASQVRILARLNSQLGASRQIKDIVFVDPEHSIDAIVDLLHQVRREVADAGDDQTQDLGLG
jgi:hypothetical protein